VRIIECIQGQVQVEIVCEPMLDYGARPASWSVVQSGEEGVCMMDATDDVTAFRLFSDIRMGIEGNRAHGRHTMVEGEKRRFWIPESLAYAGNGPVNGDLVFDIELIKIN